MNIDSDKLDELLNSLSRAVAGHPTEKFREGGVRVINRIRDAIQSGELAAKAVYARAPDDCLPYSYITPGRLYPVVNDDGRKFDLEDDEGGVCGCEWKCCHHLHGANWERVEK